MTEERRANPNPMDIAGVLAILYTVGYLVMVGFLFFIKIPVENKDPMLQLFGLMSAIQMALISFYFGSSKAAEATSRALAQRQGRTDAVMQEIVAKTGNGGGSGSIPAKDVVVTAAGDVNVKQSP